MAQVFLEVRVIQAFPYGALPVVPRADLGFVNALCRWLAGGRGAGWLRVERLVGGPIEVAGVEPGRFEDRYGGSCAVRLGGTQLEVRGSNMLVRQVAQHLLGGPEELPAPRPLGVVEQAIWALTVAAALEDLGVPGEVVACEAPPAIEDAREVVAAVHAAGIPATAAIRAPRAIQFRAAPARMWRWPDTAMVESAIVCGRCAIPAQALGALSVRAVVTLEPALGAAPIAESGRIAAELVVLGGAVGIAGDAGSLVAEVTTGYVPRAMALPDDAHVELTVGLGTAQLSLRQVFELAVGQVVPLGRPLAGPYEIRAAGRRVGYGELVNVDGELGVRIVSLEEQ